MQRSFGFTIFPEAWSLLGGPWGDQWYNWGRSRVWQLMSLQLIIIAVTHVACCTTGSCVATVMTLERLAGVSYSSTDRAAGAAAGGVLTVRDFMPDGWERVDVRLPLGGGQWARVSVERTGEHSKRITVSDNPFGGLALQPALGSKTLTKAEPVGYKTETSGDRVAWLFVGDAATAAAVHVEWA